MATDRTSPAGASAPSASDGWPSRTTVTRRSFNVSAARGVMCPPVASITVSPRVSTRASVSVIISNLFTRTLNLEPYANPTLGATDSEARRRDGRRDPPRLPRRCAPDCGAEGRVHLPVGSGASNERQSVARLHGRVELRERHDHVGRGADDEGPRLRPRGAPRHYRRGYRRLGADAQLPARDPPRAESQIASNRLSAQQTLAASGGGPRGVHRLLHRRSLRRRVRTGLRGAVPESRAHRRAAALTLRPFLPLPPCPPCPLCLPCHLV